MDVDYLIIGAGILGLSVAKTIRERLPAASISVIEKEPHVAEHASGRNSGVLHAGFYYTADSLKARFTVKGNSAMRAFCHARSLPINTCGKLVVATNDAEVEQLHELKKRGDRNGSQVELISEEEASRLEPNIRTTSKALYSPLTATVNPKEICQMLQRELEASGVRFFFSRRYQGRVGTAVRTNQGQLNAGHVINCAGLYADKIARDFGYGDRFTIIPFKGLYLKYEGPDDRVRMNIYPVPNLKNPFLGVHFTKTVDGHTKIGPTAIPAFWRENYQGLQNFDLRELLGILYYEAKLFFTNSFGFRNLALEEMRKYSKSYLIKLSQALVQKVEVEHFGDFTRPGIRAQLLDKNSLQLVQDFVVEGGPESTHILNAVSPGFTCAFPFAEYVFENYIQNNQSHRTSNSASR